MDKTFLQGNFPTFELGKFAIRREKIDGTYKYSYNTDDLSIKNFNDPSKYMIYSADNDEGNLLNLEIEDFPELIYFKRTTKINKDTGKRELATVYTAAPDKKMVITNDGMIMIPVSANLIVIYDILQNNKTTFNEILIDYKESLENPEPSSGLLYNYLISVKDGKIIPLKISDTLFSIDCESISNFERDTANSNYFIIKDGDDINNINVVNLLPKKYYNIKIFNNENLEYAIENGVFTVNSGSGIIELW